MAGSLEELAYTFENCDKIELISEGDFRDFTGLIDQVLAYVNSEERFKLLFNYSLDFLQKRGHKHKRISHYAGQNYEPFTKFHVISGVIASGYMDLIISLQQEGNNKLLKLVGKRKSFLSKDFSPYLIELKDMIAKYHIVHYFS